MTARLKPGAKSRRPAPLRGKVVLITGAGRGIGRALANDFAAAGATLVLAARTGRGIGTAARTIVRRGGRALPVLCDVRDPAAVSELVRRALAEFKRIDILVNNAGAFQIAPLADTTEALWDAIVDTNLKGTYLVTRAALGAVVRARGQVVNMVSVAGRMAFPGDSAYCASKWGVLGFTNVLREELRPLGVRVTAVLPGAVDTPVWDHVPGDWNRTQMLAPAAVARFVVAACTLPPECAVDECTINPTGGPQ
jgi:3-oxoacyl-[acyl-carrier protein] reductase